MTSPNFRLYFIILIISLKLLLWFLVFFSFGVFFFPIFAMQNPGNKKKMAMFFLTFYIYFFKFIGIKYEIRGMENVRLDKSALFMSPHQSFIDVALFSNIAKPFWIIKCAYIIVKKEVRNIPFLGYGLEKLGTVIFVDRKDRNGTIKMYYNAADKYKDEQKFFGVFIEGTRNPTRKLLPFKRVPFQLALDYNLSIQMIAVSQYQWYREKKPMASINAIVKFLPQISIDGYNKDNLDDLMKHCRNIMQIECDKLNKELDEKELGKSE